MNNKMNSNEITNRNLRTTDWAKHDRQQFLKDCPRPMLHKSPCLIGGIPANQVWGNDVSASDRRSVKAHLVGRGDYRVWWWALNEQIHRVCKPNHTLEHAMYYFHWRHLALTGARLEIAKIHWDIMRVIQTQGIMQGARFVVAQLAFICKNSSSASESSSDCTTTREEKRRADAARE